MIARVRELAREWWHYIEPHPPDVVLGPSLPTHGCGHTHGSFATYVNGKTECLACHQKQFA